MNRFSMDYSNANRPATNRYARRAGRLRGLIGRGVTGRLRGYLLALLLVSVSAVLLSGVRLRQLHTDNQVLRELHDAQRLRYDSLLSAKLEADRRLHRMLNKPAPPAPAPLFTQPSQSNGILTTP
jgi:hypothetical protein